MWHRYQSITTILNIRNTLDVRRGEMNLYLILWENFTFLGCKYIVLMVFIWLFQETYSWETKHRHTKNAAETIQVSTWPVGNRDSWFYHRNKERPSDFLPSKATCITWQLLGLNILELLVQMSVNFWNRSMPQIPPCQEQVRLRKSPVSLPLLAARSLKASPWINALLGQHTSVFLPFAPQHVWLV